MLSSLISVDISDIAKPLHAYGVDSLITVEMRNWFMQTSRVDETVFEILGGTAAATLGRTIFDKRKPVT